MVPDIDDTRQKVKKVNKKNDKNPDAPKTAYVDDEFELDDEVLFYKKEFVERKLSSIIR